VCEHGRSLQLCKAQGFLDAADHLMLYKRPYLKVLSKHGESLGLGINLTGSSHDSLQRRQAVQRSLKRMVDAKPKPHKIVKDDAREKREAERRRKLGPLDPLKRGRRGQSEGREQKPTPQQPKNQRSE
jgi:hypothetical protein